MSEPEFVVPRCSHGNIILGCPDDDCPEQNAYVAAMNKKYDDWYASLMPSHFRKDSDDETDGVVITDV